MSDTADDTTTGTLCVAADHGRLCAASVSPDAPLDLCTRHLLIAHDWVVQDVGVTDLLPGPCLACGSRLGVHYPAGWLCAICEWRFGDLPDHDAAALRVDVVYYIRRGKRVKIGTSGNPRRRLASLPHDELLAFERGGRQLEQRRHAQFADHRMGSSEWFEAHETLTEHICEISAGIEDPWSRYAGWVSRELQRNTSSTS